MKWVELDGKQFPVVTLICPPDDGDEQYAIPGDDENEFSRSLGSGGRDNSMYVPAENGMLFELSPNKANDPGNFRKSSRDGTWDLWLCARACYKSYDPDGWIWLPQGVQLEDGELRHCTYPGPGRYFGVKLGSFWTDADEEWVAETIMRLAHKPFVQPQGPEVRLVHGDYFDSRHSMQTEVAVHDEQNGDEE